jgi:nucleotide-binding universal stress UspA family protein
MAWLVVVVESPATRWAGLAWIAGGFVMYWVYRRRVVRLPLRETARAPALVLGPSLELDYRAIVVPVVRSAESEEALIAAARLAADKRATVALVHVLEVPMDLPLDADLGTREDEADDLLDQARALVEQYGVRCVTRLVRARSASAAIVAEASRRNADLVVIGSGRHRGGPRAPIFGLTVDRVLKGSPCRVLVTAGAEAR